MEAVDYCEAEKRVKEFKETKAGVKGIVDSGATKIPKMFIHPPEDLQQAHIDHDFRVPVIDLKGLDQSTERRNEVINEISKAAEEWGFFQIMNHGVPLDVMEEILKGVRRFHEQPHEAKVECYSLDFKNKAVNYYSNGNLNASNPADWRDSMSWNCRFVEDQSNFQALPQVCRNVAGLIGAGGVIRDCEGNWCFGFSKNIGRGEVLQADSIGLATGLQAAVNLNINHIMAVTDSAVLVNLIQSTDLDLLPLGTVRHCQLQFSDEQVCFLFYQSIAKGIWWHRRLARKSLDHELGICRLPSAPTYAIHAALDDTNGLVRPSTFSVAQLLFFVLRPPL